MTDQESPDTDLDAALKDWRQGDFALNVGGFLYASLSESNDPYDPAEVTENIVGLIVISQSCDIVRSTGGRFFVAVCPLVKVAEEQIPAIRKGRKPYFANVENTDEAVFADLSKVMSIHKDIVRTWEHKRGFTNEEKRLRFAAALERKFGQFAFPDTFDQATKEFRERVWSRHTRPNSELGKAYRSLAQIRFRADPSWTATTRAITVIAILQEKSNREVDREIVHKELKDELAKIVWPPGYVWADPDFMLGTSMELSAEDLITSQPGDFDFLCY